MKKYLTLMTISVLFCACWNDGDSCNSNTCCVRHYPKPICQKTKPCQANQTSTVCAKSASQKEQQGNSDRQLALKIYQAIAADHFLSKSSQFVDISAADGIVTLTGTVLSDIESFAIAKKVRAIDGVISVENNLTVSIEEISHSNKEVPAQRQQTNSDWNLELKIHQAIRGDNFLSKSAEFVDVHTADGVVTLIGNVSSDIESLIIEKKVRNIEGVKKVENKLTGSAQPLASSNKPDSKQEQQTNSDWQLALKIHQAIASDNFLSRSTQFVDIHTVNGVVILSGIVSSDTESLLIEKKVKNIEGVKKVENQLTGFIRDASSSNKFVVQEEQQTNYDWQLTLKVYQTILSDTFLAKSAQFVDVNAINGVIILTGTVSSDIESHVLEKKVKNIQGVKKVENRLTSLKTFSMRPKL